jgi:hypothetical protein
MSNLREMHEWKVAVCDNKNNNNLDSLRYVSQHRYITNFLKELLCNMDATVKGDFLKVEYHGPVSVILA